MARVRKLAQTNYTVIDNKMIRDESLSWKAKGVFAYLWSMPDDWEFYETEVMTHAKDGRDSLRGAIKELQDAHYMRRTRVRNEKGQVKTSDWELSDKPMLEKPTQEKPTQDNPMQENPTLLSTKGLSTDLPSTEGTNDDDEAPQSDRDTIIKDWTELWESSPNSIVLKEIDGWLGEFTPDMVRFAIHVAGYYSVQKSGSVKYIQKVINGWHKRSIDTLAQAEKAAADHDKKNRKANPSGQRKSRKELIPSWATNSGDAEIPRSNSKTMTDEDRKRLADRVARFDNEKEKEAV
ncbi:DnaD domain-containing protein [Lactiplantibacillus carotarum]|uniref:DnaD domain-containing protein n=1 Tax=Lactiplantibacillus carotarum TaxID=2993456 RepID=UPI00298F27D9|nr:DnaD domain protein [Lactiplantibacillus carotarum]